MSKAVLVMDMPSSCTECRLASLVGREDVMCAIDRMSTRKYADACKDIPDWCPLRDLPEKKPTIGKESENDILCMNAGYNACIDELLKGEEG